MKYIKLFEEVYKNVYHGTPIKFDEFNDSDLYFFTDNINIAKEFGDTILTKNLVINNPFIIEYGGDWSDVPVSEFLTDSQIREIYIQEYDENYFEPGETVMDVLQSDSRDPITINQISMWVKNNSDHDGVIVNNIYESLNYIKGKVYIVFDKSQIT